MSDLILKAQFDAVVQEMEKSAAEGRNSGSRHGLLSRISEIKEKDSFPYTVEEREVEMRVKGVLIEQKILLVETDDHEYAMYLED
jgi:hypothetical protein